MLLFESLLVDLAVILAAVGSGLYFLLTSTHDYWKNRNIPYIKPSFPFGNFAPLLTAQKSFSKLFEEFYRELKQYDCGGVYNVREPVFVVCKPELIKHFLTKDFSSFHDRGLPYDEEEDPFSANLFNLEGQKWRSLREKLSPLFTSGKLKGMFPLIHGYTRELRDFLKVEICKRNGSVEMKDLLIRFTTDVIGACAFGIHCNSIKNPKAEFHVMSREMSERSPSSILRSLILSTCPKLVKFFSFKRLFSKMSDYFTKLMQRTVKYRRENKVERNDFVHHMMEIMDDETDGDPFTIELMTAQAVLFFVAGLDNVANNIGFCLHALAVDLDLQERAYQEIRSVLDEYEDKICYEAVQKMDLVARILDEGLRMYTPAGVLIRKQNEKRYVVPGTSYVLERGTSVMIPIQSLHYDEEYFPNPKKFDPERFTEEEKSNRHPYTYLPFGEGPRFCIAHQFANLEMRICFVEMLRNFRFSVAPETDLSLQLDTKAFGPTPINNFWLKISERK